VLLACDAPGAAGETVNLATGGRVSLNELVRVLNALLGSSLAPIYRAARPGDVRDSQADISHATTILGYRPVVSFQDGLSQTIDWCRAVHIPEKLSA
jgi:nucleoside-diphosphate-sugar epimerase